MLRWSALSVHQAQLGPPEQPLFLYRTNGRGKGLILATQRLDENLFGGSIASQADESPAFRSDAVQAACGSVPTGAPRITPDPPVDRAGAVPASRRPRSDRQHLVFRDGLGNLLAPPPRLSAATDKPHTVAEILAAVQARVGEDDSEIE